MVGKILSIKADNHTVSASYKDRLIAEHPRSWKRKAVIENPNHIRDLLLTRKKARQTRQQQLLYSMGEPVKVFLDALAEAGKSLSYAAGKLLEFREQYGAEAVISAIQTASRYKAFGVDYVENILYQTAHLRSSFPPVVLKDQALNQLALQEPDLLLYDAIALKKRNENHDANR